MRLIIYGSNLNYVPLVRPQVGLKGKGVAFSNAESGVTGTCLNLQGIIVTAELKRFLDNTVKKCAS